MISDEIIHETLVPLYEALVPLCVSHYVKTICGGRHSRKLLQPAWEIQESTKIVERVFIKEAVTS